MAAGYHGRSANGAKTGGRPICSFLNTLYYLDNRPKPKDMTKLKEVHDHE
jgi:hypothetical protein